ncbi:MAG: endonuclease VIII [Clostridia bacterium]|nr:endonuclease VIII [Clostridia bacterium]
MNELPECVNLARQLQDTVAGKRIRGARANASPHGFAWFWGDPALYPAMLEGRAIQDATTHGMYLELLLDDDMRVGYNDGVNLRYHAPGAKRPEKHQLLLDFEDGSALIASVQMYGGLFAFPAGAMVDNKYYRAAYDKPSPLSDAFDAAYFAGILSAASPKLSAKALLATEQRVPGLGNGVLQDILFRARIHPKRKVGALSSAQCDALFGSVKQTLADMTAGGGRDVEKDLFGKPGGYRTLLSNKTAQFPCPVCGAAIVRQAYLGGNVYFCPVCQPLEN